MSFGASIGDGILLAQLAYKTFQGARQAGGEHDELARETNSLYKVLSRLRLEIANTNSPINRADDERRQELEENASGCHGLLKAMNHVLKKYNKLGPEERKRTRWWQKIRFGGQTRGFTEIRIKLSTYTSAIMMSLNLCSLDSMGEIEATLRRLETQSGRNGRDIQGIRRSLHWATAKMTATMEEGSVWTSYTNDDETFWRTIRRELVNKGYNSSVLRTHKRIIKKYLEELGSRGVFDDQENAKLDSLPEEQVELVEKSLVGNENSLPDRDSSSILESQSEATAFSPSTLSIEMDNSGDSLANSTGTLARQIHLPVDESQPVDTEAPCGIAEPGAMLTAQQLVDQPSPPTCTQFHAYVEDCIDEDLMDFQSSEHGEARRSTVPNGNWGETRSTQVQTTRNDGFVSSSPLKSTEVPEPAISVVTQSNVKEGTVLIAAGKDTEHTSQLAELPKIPSPKNIYKAQIELVVDEDFEIGSHPNVFSETEHPVPVLQYCEPTLGQEASNTPSNTSQSTASPKHCRNESVPGTFNSPQHNSKPPLKIQKRVHFSDPALVHTENQLLRFSDDLRFIFYNQYRDFGTYQELQESYQVSWDDKTAAGEEPVQGNPETSTFITHSPYTPPATVFNLNYWSIPVNYFHTFWHPERVPLYLHGNVFDGISLANWINGWTALEFGEDSFQMSKIKKFGDTVRKLGSAVSDIDNAMSEQKAALPRDLYDLGTDIIWKQLENVLRDIMSDAQNRRSWSPSNSRLEGEFVKQLWVNHILGAPYNVELSNFQQQADDWIKRVKLHPAFVLLWDVFEI